MSGTLMRLLINLRSVLKSGILYVTIAAMLLICLILSGVTKKDNDDIRVGIAYEDISEFNDVLTDELRKDAYTYNMYEDAEDLKQAVVSGKADYGFIIGKDMIDRISDDDTDSSVEFVTTPFAVYGEVVKESFAQSFIAASSEYIIKDEAYKAFNGADDKLIAKLNTANEGYLDSDLLFDVNIIGANSEDPTDKNTDRINASVSDYVRAVIAAAVFMMIFAVYGRKYKGDIKAIAGCIDGGRRSLYYVSYMSASAIPVAIAGFIMCLIWGRTDNLLIILLKFIGLIILSMIWTYITGIIIKREATYIALIPVVMGVQMVFGFVFINLHDYMPILNVLKYIFPVSALL